MNRVDQPPDRAPHPLSASAFFGWTFAGFALLSLLLTLGMSAELAANPVLLIRAGILRDLTAELPAGNQALVSSLAFMPLPTLVSVLFAPFLTPADYGLACAYALALAVALAGVPLALLFERMRLRRGLAAACALAVELAAVVMLVPGMWCDALFCLPCLAAALHFEASANPVRRALAGVFWSLAAFAHVAGLALAGARMAFWLLDLAIRRRERNARATVALIQALGLVYVTVVLLFLNWMIMGSAWYPLRQLPLAVARRAPGAALQTLERILDRSYADFAPVTSGHWGYLAQDAIERRQGARFIDFHPDKLPVGGRGQKLLVAPGRDNPLRAWADRRLPVGVLKLKSEGAWDFYLVSDSVW